MITSLKPNEIFVAGTNGNGHHYGGAAKQAYEDFGLEWGLAEGMSGQSYAFPTLNKDMQRVFVSDLVNSRDKLYQTANENKHLIFLLTPVGTGIAGFSIEVIEALFTDLPENVIKTW